MDAPKCKVCGARHWSGEPHQGEARTQAPLVPASRLKSPAPTMPLGVSLPPIPEEVIREILSDVMTAGVGYVIYRAGEGPLRVSPEEMRKVAQNDRMRAYRKSKKEA